MMAFKLYEARMLLFDMAIGGPQLQLLYLKLWVQEWPVEQMSSQALQALGLPRLFQ